MTNKKLKMAAMSVALTACVAASPLAANADAPAAAPEELEKEPVAEETKKEENTAEPQVNKQDEKAQETLKDAEVEYDKEHPTTNPDGSETLDGVIVTKPEEKEPEGGETGSETGSETGGETDTKPEGSGETNPNPNPGSGETGSEEKKPEEIKPEEKEPEKVEIGTAEKTEKTETNVETKPDPGAEPIVDTTTPPTAEKNPDGSTTITQPTVTPGKETTTTTGSGEAKGDLHEKEEEVPKEDIDLTKELGEKPDISWNIEKGADAVNGYKVEDVTNNGNQQTLKLKKEEETTAEMTAEDIAKLVDADKLTMNENGTYTLTRTETILDAEGNPQTRTTYITIRDNKVTTKTTTELTITREKAEQDGEANIPTDVVLPEVELNNGKTLPYTKLDEMLQETGGKDANGVKDGEYTYKETDEDGTVREYTIKINTTSTDQLSSAEIVAKLNNDRYSAEGEDIYYRADNGERVKLDVKQKAALRRNLSINISVTETKKEDTTEAPDEVTTKNEVKDEAVRNALKSAVEKLDVDDPNVKAELTSAIENATLDPNGGIFTKEVGGKTYTLTYTGAEVTVVTTEAKDTNVPDKNPEDITDVKDNTVTGTAYVTSGTISWTAEGQKGEYTATVGDASVLTPPEGATPEYKDGRLTGYTVTSEDADGNTVTTTYTITYGNTSSMSPEELNRLAEQNLMEKTGCKTLEELAAAGYTNIRFDNASIVTWTVTQTTQKKTTNTENLNNETLTYEGDTTDWTIAADGSTLTYGNDVYEMKDGKFTLTVTENDKKVTYTATEQEEDVLSPEDAKAMLAKKFGVAADAITLNADRTTATFTKGDSTVTVNCANLKKRTLKIERSVDASWQKVATNDAELAAAYEELWNEIKNKKSKLGKGETLYVGDLQITEKIIKQDVIEYIEKYVTQADMSPEQLKAALKAQAEAAQKQMVTVNADSDKYREELPNYYAGERTYYTTKDGQRVENQWIHEDEYGYFYWQNNGSILDWEKVYVNQVKMKPTYIEHLDLASGAELETKDGTSMDCVLVNPTLKWNYDADKLVDNDQSNTNVGLDSTISFDNEGGKGNGHYEYDRGDNNNPDKSAFYKVTGKVLYDAVKENEQVKLFTDKDDAFEAYLEKTGQTETYQNLNWGDKEAFREKVEQTYIVKIGPSGSNKNSPSGYQVYTQSADMTAYGYMTRDANTCINRTYNRPNDSWEYVGGYDLMISKLVQTKEGKVVGETESKVKTVFAPLSIRKSTDYTHRSMKLTQMTTVTTKNDTTPLPGGSQETVKYLYDKSESVTPITEETKVEGTGTGSYKSFTNLIRNIFKGDGTGTEEGGSIKYEYRTEKNPNGDPVPFEADQMVVTTKQDAEVHYTFTSQESRDVWIKGYTQTVVPPVNPGPDAPELPPVEDAKPAPAPAPAPEAPVLPVVQDARPDPAPAPAPTPAPAPETPVLPAVQDAKLIQTGTSGWLADLMLGAGMVLSAAGYWMERKRKAMFYKSQH